MTNLSVAKYISADSIGMASSTLCLIHCMITPFIFIAQACASSCCATAPTWWKAVDFFFLVISFVAVYFSAKHTSKTWLRISFYLLFGAVSVLILNEHLLLFQIAKFPLYVAAGLLAGLHFYNRRCTNCEKNCCNTKSTKTAYTLIKTETL